MAALLEGIKKLAIFQPAEVAAACIETDALTPEFFARHSGARALKVTRPLCLRQVMQLTESLRFLEQLDIELFASEHLPLQLFEKLTCLQSLSICVEEDSYRATSGVEPGMIYAFSKPALLANLRILRITHAVLHCVIGSLSGLQLTTLCLDHCTIESPLVSLGTCRDLKVLSLVGIKGNTNRLVGQITLLSRMLTETQIEPKVALPDRRDYEGIFTPERKGCGSYSPEEIQSRKWDRDTLEKLLEIAGRDEESYWQYKLRYSYEHNACQLEGASPIVCHDTRPRYAADEPVNRKECYHFWHSVLAMNVNVILMCKAVENSSYFQRAEGAWVLFEENDASIRVVCEKVVANPSLGYTCRELRVNGKLVWHLQVDWEGYKGLESQRIIALLQEFARLEREQGGASVVHCQAGIGRTGSFFAYLIIDQLKKAGKAKPNYYFNAEEMLRALRQQRGGVIETIDQYESIITFAAR